MRKIDFHVHNHIGTSPEEAAVYMKEMIDRLGYEGIGIMASLHSSRGPYPTSNEDAMALVKLLPGSIAFAGLDHERDLVEQTKEYMERGFKGIKLLEGKPSEWRYRGYGYEHPRFDAFFDYCEKEGIPLLIHNNDPLANWDLSKADERAIKMGWVYDENVPSQEWFFEQLETRLLTHPNLRAAIAHFGFYSNDIPRAERLMEPFFRLSADAGKHVPIGIGDGKRIGEWMEHTGTVLLYWIYRGCRGLCPLEETCGTASHNGRLPHVNQHLLNR